MEGLRVEAVAVATGDVGHTWAEAADDDRRRRLRPQEPGLAAPQPPDHRNGIDHALCAYRVGRDRLTDGRLLRRVRCAAAAAGAEAEEQATVGNGLQRC